MTEHTADDGEERPDFTEPADGEPWGAEAALNVPVDGDRCIWCKGHRDDAAEGVELHPIGETGESICSPCLKDARRYKRDRNIILLLNAEFPDEFREEVSAAMWDAAEEVVQEHVDRGNIRPPRGPVTGSTRNVSEDYEEGAIHEYDVDDTTTDYGEEEADEQAAECIVCGDPVDDDADKYDDSRPVYTDEGAYHLGCEEDVFEEVYANVDENADPVEWVRGHANGIVTVEEFLQEFDEETLQDLTPDPLTYSATEELVYVADGTTYEEYRADMEEVGLARVSGLVQKAPVVVEAELVETKTEIETREGSLYAYGGDVLIRGVEGEVYPCDPTVFAKTYVPSDPDTFALFREVVPEGVGIEFEDLSEKVTIPTGVYVEEGADLDDEQREEAEEFVREYAAAMPTIRGDPLDDSGEA